MIAISGPTKTSIRPPASGLQVDLRVVPPDSLGRGAAVLHRVQAHNVAVRQIAVRKKLRLSEYGLFDVETGELIVSAPPRKRSTRARPGLDTAPDARGSRRVEVAARGTRYHGSFGK